MSQVLIGDCRGAMRQWIADGVRVQMAVTSPPYFGLRDYGHPGQIGLEDTPQEYVAALVEVFGLVWELLADDGTLWVNLGDSYAQAGGRGEQGKSSQRLGRGNVGAQEKAASTRPPDGFKPKDLIGIPWRVAFALQEFGWYLRQDIIWHKPNPMPESVTDRCTKAHEYLFILSKSPRYYFDAAAISEPVALSTVSRLSQDVASQLVSARVPGKTNGNMKAVAPRFGGAKYGDDDSEKHRTKSGNEYAIPESGRRNRRSVWTIPTMPYSGAHFAVFPPALIEPCILAGSRPGDVVLDPFFGSGTGGEVCERLGRQWIGCELNPEYERLQKQRTAQLGLAL